MKKTYILQNLNCANCANKIETRIKKVKNVLDANLNFSISKLEIKYKSEDDINEIYSDIRKIIKEIEPDVKIKEENEEDDEEDGDSKKDIIVMVIGFLILAIALILKAEPIKTIFYILSYFILSTDIIIKAFKNFKNGIIFDENFLMVVATIGALLIGENFEAVLVMLLYKIGESLSDFAVSNSKKSISDLMNIKANYATKIVDKKEIKVKPEELEVGDIIIIKPGEKIPTDSIVIEGSSEIDTSSMTGESVYTLANKDDKIISGTINISGALTAKVTKIYAESEVAKIIELLENSTNLKAKSEKFITKFSRYYTPVVIVLAILLTLIPSLISHGVEYDYIYKSLSFLVVSCPCALVISIPLTYFSAIGFASSRGILVKGTNYLDQMCNVKNILFDKTGTITNGKFSVENIETNNISKEEFLRYIKAAEDYSNHPIALAIKEHVKDVDINNYALKDIKDIPGYGVELNVNNEKVIFGNEKLMKERNIKINKSKSDNTVCYLAINDEYKGYVSLCDSIKDNSKKCIEALKKDKVKSITILTGDNEKNAQKVANELNVKEYSNLLPINKVEKVDEAKSTGITAFVGDGINDAPVLMTADIGIAMGGIGSDIAIEAADAVIMNDDIYKVVELINISKFSRKIVIQNIVFSIFIKVAILLLITLGFSNMIFAIFADVGVTILAVLNSMRVFKMKIN